MNPFTESTVARPLSESASGAASNDAEQDKPHQDGVSVAKDTGLGHRPARYPRSGRLMRRRNRGQVSRRLAWPAWPAQGRRVAGAVLGLFLTFSLPGAWAVNANSATAQQLETITGIGPKTAQLIIDERTRGGSFESFDDLSERVKGIGPKKARSLQAAGLKVGDAANVAGSTKPATQPAGKARR